LQDWEVKTSLIEQGTRGKSPLARELAVVLLDVSMPEFIPRKIEGSHLAVAVEEDYNLPISDGGWGREVAPVVMS
jgi:hypothetical protein